MSANLGAASRRRALGGAHRLGSVAAIPLILAMLAVSMASADLPPALHIDAADAARAGTTIRLVAHPLRGSSLIEVETPSTAPAARSLLAISPDGGQVALADQVGELSGQLTVARADGSQLRVQLPGLLAAGFAPDSAWLAVIDGRGALWRVVTASGEAALIADGPFLGSPIVRADGSLMLLSVPSVEAPYRSQLVQVAPTTGAVTAISDDELVYAGFPMADGSVAVVVHEPGRTVVRTARIGGSELLADLGPDAVNVAVAPDGHRIAYEVTGRGIFLIDGLGTRPRSLGTGSRPCFAVDASALLIRRGPGNVALALDGSVLAVTDHAAGLAGAAGCLP